MTVTQQMGRKHMAFERHDLDRRRFRRSFLPDTSITLVARSGEGARGLSTTLDVIIEVVDGEDMGVVVLSQRQPEVGVAIHATVSDEDGGVTIRRRVWELSELVTVSDRGAPSAECLDNPDTPGIDVVDEDSWSAIAALRRRQDTLGSPCSMVRLSTLTLGTTQWRT